MKKLQFLALSVIGFSALVFASCGMARGEMAVRASGAGKTELRQVRTCLVKEITIPDELSGFGSLSFLKKVDITSPQEGTVRTMLRQEGTPVLQGSVVAVLDNPQINLAVNRARNAWEQAQAAVELARSRLLEGKFQAEARILDLAKTEAALVQARKEYQEQARKLEDQEALYKAGGITEDSIRSARFALESMAERLRLQEQDLAIRWVGLRTQDLRTAGFEIPKNEADLLAARIRLATTTLQAEVLAAEAQLGAASRELESAQLAEQELTLKSPLAGILAVHYVEPGERVKRDDKLLTIIDTHSLYATIPVREQDGQRILIGMEASVYIDGLSASIPARVDLVSPTADNQSFTFMVRLLLDSPSVQKAKLKPGMFARATIRLGKDRTVLVIPESALAEKQADKGRVFIIQQNQVLGKTIQLGQVLGTNREVLEGLASQMVLVDKPDGGLQEGDHVEILQ